MDIDPAREASDGKIAQQVVDIPHRELELVKAERDELRQKLEACCTPEIIKHYEVTCPECGNYYAGHATGGNDICTCGAKGSQP